LSAKAADITFCPGDVPNVQNTSLPIALIMSATTNAAARCRARAVRRWWQDPPRLNVIDNWPSYATGIPACRPCADQEDGIANAVAEVLAVLPMSLGRPSFNGHSGRHELWEYAEDNNADTDRDRGHRPGLQDYSSARRLPPGLLRHAPCAVHVVALKPNF